MVVAKVKLVQVVLKVLPTYAGVGAFNGSLADTPSSFNGLSVDIPAHPFVLSVVHLIMRFNFPAKLVVAFKFPRYSTFPSDPIPQG